MMRSPADPVSFIGHNIDIFVCTSDEAVPPVRAQVELVVTIRNIERLREFARAGAKLSFIIDAAPCSHQFDAASRFECTDQNETVGLPFHEHVQHPMRAVTEVNISRSE